MTSQKNHPKFCIDCRWFKPKPYLLQGPVCMHKSAIENSADYLVNRTPHTHHSCLVMRDCDCGEEAKYWEPK